MNFHPLNDLELIAPRPLLFITGDQAHSREFCEEAYRLATGSKNTLGFRAPATSTFTTAWALLLSTS
jgi:hypothetical protein